MDECDIARFWKYVERKGSDDCWLWTGKSIVKGYGQIRVSRHRITLRVHRLSWMLHAKTESIPAGMLVCHHCDTPLCVNPARLFLGTPEDNMRDKIRKGRDNSGRRSYRVRRLKRAKATGNSPLGSNCPWAKLTECAVVEIRNAFASGAKARAIAAEHNVSVQTVWSITSGRGWKHV